MLPKKCIPVRTRGRREYQELQRSYQQNICSASLHANICNFYINSRRNSGAKRARKQPPHREAEGGLGKMGPQRDHRTESDFPASCTQRTIEMQHEQICSEASRAATTETPLPLGASDYVANAQTKSNDSDSQGIEVRHHNRIAVPKSRSTSERSRRDDLRRETLLLGRQMARGRPKNLGSRW